MKLYNGCYGVLNNGEVVGPMADTKDGSYYPFEALSRGGPWTERGTVWVTHRPSGHDFRSVHPTREEAEAAARGERPFMQGFTDWRFWVAGAVIGLIVAYFLFGCTSPTETAPHCQYQEHTFSHDSGLDTVICLDSIAYGQKQEQ